LHGIILRTRPAKVAHAYEKIWLHDTDESPLRFYTRRQAELLNEQLGRKSDKLIVRYAMRYGTPSIQDEMKFLQDQGCDRILILPMYPQYSATTTATVTDKVFDILKSQRLQPAIRVVPPFYDHELYIRAVGDSIYDYLKRCEKKPDLILASFHGLPKENLGKGDPYYCHCAVSTRLLREYLGMSEDELRMTFQSRFGPKEWLQPYTDKTLESLASEGIKHVAVITPGFPADCLETLEEMNMVNRGLFLQAGGERYDFIPCLNDSDLAINMFSGLISQELEGWV
jgi:ferrochelatase